MKNQVGSWFILYLDKYCTFEFYTAHTFRKTVSHVFNDTDNPMIIYVNSGSIATFFHETDDPTTIYGRFWILQRTFMAHKHL